jgi:hypothetical protein
MALPAAPLPKDMAGKKRWRRKAEALRRRGGKRPPPW